MKHLSRRGYALLAGLAFGLLAACSNITPTLSEPTDIKSDTGEQSASADVCPPPAEALPEETLQKQIGKHDYVFNRFDYAPRRIVTGDRAVRFLAREYDFVYCREDDSWTVQPGTLDEEWIVRASDRFSGKETFSALEIDGRVYQYRVVRDPLSDGVLAYDAVSLELIVPSSEASGSTSEQEIPQRHRLYTLADVQQDSGNPEVGPEARLGIPYITQTLAYGDRLWWTVAFEQGEGNQGIATVVSYELSTGEISLIQPEEIWSQQILDLALTGEPQQPTLWMGLKRGSEGKSSVPASGLVAYQPDSTDLSAGSISTFTPYNSPLIGAIPTQLTADGDTLWVGTRNGACRFNWQTPAERESWNCWQFVAEAVALPSTEEIPVYPSLLSQTPAKTLPAGQPVEVLWWMMTNVKPQQGRYEVRLEESFEVTTEQGAAPIEAPQWVEIAGRVPMFWPGYWWRPQGDRFVRPLDSHLNDRIAGDRGIGPQVQPGPRNDWYAMRGDLELLELTAESTRVRHYSGWVDDSYLVPLPAAIEKLQPEENSANPLAGINRELRERAATD